MSTKENDEFRHFYTNVSGIKLHWASIGNAHNVPPVVLLHGLTDCYLTWKRIAVDLSSTRRILIPDLPGHGLSARPDASYSLQWYAQVMSQWLQTIEVEKIDLVGHSFGGGVAQMLLKECRPRIRRLILLSSGGLGREVGLELRLASIPWVVETWGQPFMGLGTWLALWHLRRTLSHRHIAELSTINAQKGSARAFARTVRDVINWQGQYRNFLQHADELPELPPIALFWGGRDRIIPAEHAHMLAQVVDGVHLKVFDACGHYPHHEQPQLVAQAFRDFIDAPLLQATRLKAECLFEKQYTGNTVVGSR